MKSKGGGRSGSKRGGFFGFKITPIMQGWEEGGEGGSR